MNPTSLELPDTPPTRSIPAAAAASRPKAVFLVAKKELDVIYGPEELEEIGKLVDLGPQGAMPVDPRATSLFPEKLKEAEILFSGWGAPVMDQAFLAAAPNLRAVFYGAGSIRYFTPAAFWDRDIVITSAYAANAVPVAEYALAVTLLSLKQFWGFNRKAKKGEGWEGDHLRVVPGAFRSTVGLVSFGMIARKFVDLLQSFDMRVVVFCPFMKAEEARALGVELCGLEEVFARSDVVSVHTPLLPETRGMVDGPLISRMKEGATLVNTSRGDVIAEGELIEVLGRRPDLTAILDVCHDEPRAAAELLALPNVVLTPHIAGSLGPECHRLGSYMVQELRRYLAGEPLRWQITREMAARMA